jgi:hypothetical protein
MSNTQDVDSVVNAVFQDLPQPSPVADMPQEDDDNTPPPVDVAPAADAPKKRGRPRKNPLIGGEIPKTARPKLDGVKEKILDTTSPAQATAPEIDAAAHTATMLVAMSGLALGGQDAAMTQNESVYIFGGMSAYFKAKGINDVPAWVILAGALVPYYSRVLSTPPAKSKVITIFGAVGRGIKNLWKRARGKNDTRAYSRYNDERENNPSQTSSS